MAFKYVVTHIADNNILGIVVLLVETRLCGRRFESYRCSKFYLLQFYFSFYVPLHRFVRIDVFWASGLIDEIQCGIGVTGLNPASPTIHTFN